MTREEAIKIFNTVLFVGKCDAPKEELEECLKMAIEALEEPKVKNMERLTNAEWVDFLSEQFNISRTSAKEMIHVMMSVKKEDNFKKLFSQG